MTSLRFAYNLADIPAQVSGNHVIFDKKKAWDTPERGEVVKLDGRYHRIVSVSTAGNFYDMTVQETHDEPSW